MTTKYLSIRELRPKLPSVVRDASATSARYIVTRRGKPEAVILSIDDYESLIETLEIQSDRALLRRLRQAEAEIKKGRRGKSLQQIHRELGFV
jgi:prevent-host-death family protein